MIYGNINARNAVIQNYTINIDKKNEKYPELKIALVSDIHLGTMVYEKYLKKLTETINNQNPDIVLFAGDIMDEELSPILRNDIGNPLKQLHPKLGVWAIAGNHEHIGNFNKAINYIKTLNINVLIDTSVLIDNSFYLVGRNDKDSKRFGNGSRKTLKSIVDNIDKNLPLILMDHQPANLNEAIENKIDIQLSGHTHNGQFFPFNLITKKVFELSYGYLQKEKTHFYVSSGFGTWGPPIRIGSKPEIVFINLKFRN
jgi:predicted MPP superfamily phosphohydrolase